MLGRSRHGWCCDRIRRLEGFMQIIVKQSSGLGNQLFQYAAGRCLAKRHDASLRIASQLPHVLVSHGHARPALLQHFAIPAMVQQAGLFDRLVVTERPELLRAARIARALFGVQVLRQPPESCLFHQELRVAPGARRVYLHGFWQDHSIVQEVERELRSELMLIEALRGRNLEMAKRIDAARNPVSIHLRRGDYGQYFGAPVMLPMAYYEHAISHILSQHRQSTFFVFSDDAAFARDWLQGDPRFILVDHNNEATAHEDLRLMSLCRHHIIANSTFSWWGAWLNPRRDKQVIAPARWLGFDTAETAIACPGWTLLDAELPRRLMPLAAQA
jgi:hypothetical protein